MLPEMVVNTFVIAAMHESLFQVRQVLAGLPEEAWDKKLVPAAMSPRETVEHLCHATQAFLETAKTGSFNWETPYSSGATSPDEVMIKLAELRAEADKIIESSDLSDGKLLSEANAFLTQHDSYHVGQLALVRLSRNEGWDPYSLYPHD